MKNQVKFLLLTLPLLFVACSENDPEISSLGLFEAGVFVSNEGSYGEGDGTLSFINSESGVSNNLFSVVNDRDLGDVVQSLHIADELLFIVVNNSNKVEAVSLDSLHSTYTIEDLSLPRYMVSHEGVGYVTEWVSFSEPGRVTLFDLETGAIEKSIPTDFGAEGVIISDGKLFVSNSFSTTVTIINLETKAVEKTLEVGSSPTQMVVDAEGDVWVACAGGYDAEFNPLNNGKFVEINPASGATATQIELGTNVSGKLAISPAGSTLYYTLGHRLYGVATSQSSVPEMVREFEAAVSFYGIGVDSEGTFYLADAKGFAENGQVFVYSRGTTTVEVHNVGRGPNGFAFN